MGGSKMKSRLLASAAVISLSVTGIARAQETPNQTIPAQTPAIPNQQAQAAPASPPPAAVAPPISVSAANSGQIEQINVTANKRSENIKDVPTAISVLGGTDLSEHHVQDYDDITRNAPGISFGTQGGEGLNNIEIRGVSSTTGSATVGIYLDDVSVTIKNTYDGATQPKLLDMDRIEVLRGPQGTLYGASSEGGTIRFITNQPDLDQFSASATSDLSGTKHGSVNYDEQGVVNYPIIPGMLAIRAALEYGDDSGWIDNFKSNGQLISNGDSAVLGKGPLNQSGVNDVRDGVFRLTGKLQLAPDFTITPSMFFQRSHSSDAPDFFPLTGLYEQTKEVTEFNRDTLFLPSVTVNKGLGFADLTSVSSYFWRQESRQTDGTFYNSTVYALFFLDNDFPEKQPQNDSQIGTLPSPVTFQTTYGTLAQEFRLTSRPPSETGLPIKWVAGVYYSDQWDTHRDYEPIVGLQSAVQSIYGVPITQLDSKFGPGAFGGDPAAYIPLDSPTDPHLNDIFYFSTSRSDERQYAAFGQVDFDVTPQLHGSAGLRFEYARESYTRYGGGFIDLGNISPYVQNTRYYPLTPKFSVTYDLDDTSSVYASAAKGFRLGGPTGPTPAGPNNACSPDYAALGITNPPVSYNPDKLWSYEVGSKALLANNTISLNGALYYIDWQQLQQTINLPTCGFNFTSNVGDAESYGSELELRYKPTFLRGLTLGMSGGLERAVITSTTNPQTAAVGEKVLNSPDWTFTVSADYNWEIMNNVVAFVRSDYDWVGRSHGSFTTTDPNFSDPQYGVFNASIGIDTGSLQVSLYAKNLFDDSTIIQRPKINTVIEGYTVRPLTVGVTVSKQF
jgi:iron complex outermembrane recepter protein